MSFFWQLFLVIGIVVGVSLSSVAEEGEAEGEIEGGKLELPFNPFISEGEIIEVPSREARFLILDKITARKEEIVIESGQVVQFGTLFVRLRHCVASVPEDPLKEAKTLIEVYERPPGGEGVFTKIFSGWMFASSPGINGLEHAVYDIWPISCKDRSPDS